MKQLCLILALFITATSFSQVIKAPMHFDKGAFDTLALPDHDTITPNDKSKSWVVRMGTVLYVWNGNKWEAIAGGGGPTITDSTYLDWRDFYNTGTINDPIRIRRYDNAYIDNLIANLQIGGNIVSDTMVTYVLDPPYYDIQIGYMLLNIIVEPSVNANFAIGSGAGLGDISEADMVNADDGETCVINRYARNAAKRLYFTGLPTGSGMYFVTKKIK